MTINQTQSSFEHVILRQRLTQPALRPLIQGNIQPHLRNEYDREQLQPHRSQHYCPPSELS